MRYQYILKNCLLFLAVTFTFLAFSEQSSFALSEVSVIEGHNTCAQCHGRFPATPVGGGKGKGVDKTNHPAVIPPGKVDILCFGCHGPGGIAATKAHVHGIQNYVQKPIGCIACHDPHNNQPNYLNGQNIKLIGQNIESNLPVEIFGEHNYAEIQTPNSGTKAVVFESRGTDVGQPSLNSFADGDENGDGNFTGICEVCHTKTKFHRNNPSGSHDHFTGQTCTNCHVHVNQFLAFGEIGYVDEITGTVVDISGTTWTGITLFIDINGNGVYDEGEPTATTDKDGNFVFKGIPNKGYYIYIMPDSMPDGYDVEITIKGNVVSVITTPQPVSVSGYVWSDKNMTTLFDSGDQGIMDVTVFIDLNSNEALDADEPTATTNDMGYYTIEELDYDTYWVQVDESTLPEGYELITDNPVQTTLAPGEELKDINFGYQSLIAVNPKNANLKSPTRVIWNGAGGFYVADEKLNTVFMYDDTGNLTGQLKDLERPVGLAIDAAGNIYVGNFVRRNVEIFTPAGIRIGVRGDGKIKLPTDMAFDSNNRLYVVESLNKYVRVFNPDGSDALLLGSHGTGDGQFVFPSAIAINYRIENDVEVGEIYVGDRANHKIQVFDLNGNYLRSFGAAASESGGGMMGWGPKTLNWKGKFLGIKSLDFDQMGRLHVLDDVIKKVQILDPVTGAYIGSYNAHTGDQTASRPRDIALDQATGEVIMTNALTRNVETIYTVQ